MTQARYSLIDLDATSYYHCVARCVRRTYPFGRDPFTGKNHEHRKEWIVERMVALAEIFCIRVCAYAIMSNRLHIVLHVDPAQAAALTQEELTRRHAWLFPLVHAWSQTWSSDKVQAHMDCFRTRLSEISWFMRCLCEFIARRANREDGYSGHFWDGRFKSRAMRDDTALLTSMNCVDLIPVQADFAESLEGSGFTAIEERLRQVAGGPQAAKVEEPKGTRRVGPAGVRTAGKIGAPERPKRRRRPEIS